MIETNDELIPYIILKTNVNGNYTMHEIDVIEKSRLHKHVLKDVTEYICDFIDVENISKADDIQNFFDSFSREYDVNYYEHPWIAKAYFNGEWHYMNPTNEEICEEIIKCRDKYDISSSDTSSVNDSSDIDDINEH